MKKGKYEIIKELRSGGMGTTWLALDDKKNNVVLKEIKTGIYETETIKRFAREIRIMKGLEHPGMVKILDVAEEPELFYVMKYYAGGDLEDSIKRGITDDLKIRYIEQLFSALEFMHSKGIIHRDIKPNNILIDGENAVISDFGLSRRINRDTTSLTETDDSFGTIEYMSPEQKRDSKHIDVRTDIYALGKTAYKLFTGECPYEGVSSRKFCEIKRPYDVLIKRMIQEDKDSRFADMGQLLEEYKKYKAIIDYSAPQSDFDKMIEKFQSSGKLEDEDAIKLNDLFKKYNSDYEFIVEKFFSMPHEMNMVLVSNPNIFYYDLLKILVDNLNNLITQKFKFAEADRWGNYFKKMLGYAKEYKLREMIYSEILHLATYINRFYLQDMFRKLRENPGSEDDKLIIEKLIKDYESEGSDLAFLY